MKKECVMIVVLLIIIIILLIVIIRQNMELRSQLINIGNYLSEKLICNDLCQEGNLTRIITNLILL